MVYEEIKLRRGHPENAFNLKQTEDIGNCFEAFSQLRPHSLRSSSMRRTQVLARVILGIDYSISLSVTRQTFYLLF